MSQPLTPMQIECLRRAASADKAIARELGLSPATVSNHIRAAMRRLGAADRREAMGLLAVHPLYEGIVIPGVEIVVPLDGAKDAPTASGALIPRPVFLGRELPALPNSLGRLYLVVCVFLMLTSLTLVGLALVNTLGDLISRHAPAGSI